MRHCALASVALLLFTFAGCGDKTSEKSGSGGGGGAGQTLAKKIVGKWDVDTAAMKAELKKQAGDNPLAGMAEAMLDGMQMSFEFKDDGSFALAVTALGQSQNQEGTWKATGESGDTLTVEMTMKDETQTDKVQFLSDDQIKIPGDGEEPDAILKRAS